MWRIFLPIFQTVGHLRLAYHLPSHFLYCWRAGGRRPPFGNATLIRKAISGMQTEQRYAPSLLGQLPVKHTALLSPLRVPVTWLMIIPASLLCIISFTGPGNNTCTWFGEVGSCCCLPLLPQLACSILATWGPPISRALYKYYFRTQ